MEGPRERLYGPHRASTVRLGWPWNVPPSTASGPRGPVRHWETTRRSEARRFLVAGLRGWGVTAPTPAPDPTRGGARWCPDHEAWECTRDRNRGRGTCHGAALLGLDRCRMHAGEPLALAKAKGEAHRAAYTAWSALGMGSGAPLVVDSATAVLGMLQVSWLRAHLYAALLADQVDRDGVGPAGVSEDGPMGDGTGLIGHRYAQGKEGAPFATSEATRGLVDLEAAERDRCVRYAKTAHDMGIAEAQIRLAERQGEAIAGGLRWFIAALVLTAEQAARVPELMSTMLRALAAGDLAQLPAGPS